MSTHLAFRIGDKVVRGVSIVLAVLTMFIAFLTPLFLLFANAVIWEDEPGMSAADWALRDTWPYIDFAGMAFAGALYLGSKALWCGGFEKPCPKLLFWSFVSFAILAVGLNIADDIVFHKALGSYIPDAPGLIPYYLLGIPVYKGTICVFLTVITMLFLLILGQWFVSKASTEQNLASK